MVIRHSDAFILHIVKRGVIVILLSLHLPNYCANKIPNSVARRAILR